MHTLVRNAIAGAALGVAAIAALQPAAAIAIRNCTGDVIRVHIHNNADALRAVPNVVRRLGPGDASRAHAGSPRAFVKVFRAQVVDRLMTERGGLSDRGSYIVLPGYRLARGARCR